MSAYVDRLLGVAAIWVFIVVAVLVFAEDALFVGFVIPGETAAVIGGVYASRGSINVVVMCAVVVAAAIVGDSVGYEVGKHFGPRLWDSKLLDNRRERLDSAREFLARRGGSAVFLGRFVAFFRAVMPALAGISHMPTAGSCRGTPPADSCGEPGSCCWDSSPATPTSRSRRRWGRTWPWRSPRS